MLIELFEGFFVNPELVAVVRASDGGKSALYTAGQSAVDDGFYIPYPADQVVEELNELDDEADDEADNEQE